MNYILKIRRERIKKRMKQIELAKKLGINKSTMSELENNKHDIHLSRLIEISDILKVDIKDLFERK